jgi:hypothetical protein
LTSEGSELYKLDFDILKKVINSCAGLSSEFNKNNQRNKDLDSYALIDYSKLKTQNSI